MISIIAFIVVIFGCMNWLSIGFFQYDIVAGLFGFQGSIFSRIVYIIIGICAIYLIYVIIKNKGRLTVNKLKKEEKPIVDKITKNDEEENNANHNLEEKNNQNVESNKDNQNVESNKDNQNVENNENNYAKDDKISKEKNSDNQTADEKVVSKKENQTLESGRSKEDDHKVVSKHISTSKNDSLQKQIDDAINTKV